MSKKKVEQKREWKFKYDPKLSICSLQLEDWWHDIKVLSLLPGSRHRSAAINAYLGARYSRSDKSIWDIAKEVLEKDINPVERLEKIFAGYGHKSVGDMADIFVCMEKVPMLFIFKFFNMNSLGAGQARSTRYQDFSHPDLITLPEGVGNDEIREEYDNILREEMYNYNSVLEETKQVLAKGFNVEDLEDKCLCSRSFDTARYLLPLALKSSFGFLTTARKWSEIIALLSASNGVVDNEVALMLKELLSPSDKSDTNKYVPEAAELIRHVEPDNSQIKSTKDVLKYIKKLTSKQEKLTLSDSPTNDFEAKISTPADEYLMSNYEALLNPLGSVNEMIYENKDLLKISEILSNYHDRHHILGNISNSRPYLFDGFCDIGSMRDLNRHRSMARFVPILYDIDMDQELNRENKDTYYLCPYLYIKEANTLRKKYSEYLENTYQRIKDWRKKAKKVLSNTLLDEYTKYLLPMAHATRYRFSADLDSLQYTADLRTRNGGHIAYRELSYSWIAKASVEDPLLQRFVSKIEKPDFKSKEQFLDRK
jgi:thymidylate synthase ThyX